MSYLLYERRTWRILFPLAIAFLLPPADSVQAASREYGDLFSSLVPFYHTYNLSSLYPVGRQTSNSSLPDSETPVSLDKCIELALEGNQDHNISRAQLRATTGDLLAAWGLYTPSMFLSYGLSQSNTSLLFTNPLGEESRIGRISRASYATLGLDYVIFSQGAKYFELKNAYYLRRARRSLLRGSELEVLYQVSTAYFNVLRQEKLHESAREQAEQLKEQLRKAKKRFSVGEVTRLDVLQAQIDLQNQELLILEYENQVIAAKMDLDLAVGGGLGVDFTLADDFGIPEVALDVDQLVAEAVEKHPILESLSMEIKQQQGNLWMGRLAYLPSIRTAVGYSRNASEFTFAPDAQRGRQIALSASWSILDAFQRFQQNRYTQVAVDTLKFTLAKTRLKIKRDVRESFLELLRLSRRNLTLEESRRMVAETLRLEMRRYELGVSSMVEVRKAQADYSQAEVDYINSIYDFHEALSQLSLNVGRDVSLDLPRIKPNR